MSGYSGRTTGTRVQLRIFDHRERVRRGVTALGVAWAAAIGSVFIPIAHFLLVPGFFLYGLYELRARLRTEALLELADGECPDCGLAQRFELSGRWSTPAETKCRQCSRRLVIDRCEDSEKPGPPTTDGATPAGETTNPKRLG